MICPSCHTTLPPAANFCSHCGARMQPAPTVPAPPLFFDRVSRHIGLLSGLWVGYGTLRIVTGLFGAVFLHAFFHDHGAFGRWGGDWNNGWPFGHSFAFWPFMGVSTLVGALLAFLAAWGLHQRTAWGRAAAIIAAVLALVHPILGTVLGIYTLWVLAPATSGFSYDAMTAHAPRA